MRRSLAYLPRFLAYVLRHFPLARVVAVLSLVLLVLDYAALSVMIPLAAPSASGAPGTIIRTWQSIASALGFPLAPSTWLWFFVVLLASTLALGYVHTLLSTWLGKQVHRHLSAKIFYRVLFDEPLVDIYRRSIGHYVTLAGDDTYRAGTIINSASQALAGATSTLAGFVLLYLFSPRILLAALAFLVVCAIVVGWGFSGIMRRNQSAVELSRELGTTFIEALNGLRSVRSMGAQEYVHRTYGAQIRRYVRILFRIEAARHAMRIVPVLLLLVVAAIVLWPGSQFGDGITVSYFLALTAILTRIFVSLGNVVVPASTLVLDLRAAKDIDELVRESPHHAVPLEAPAERIDSVALVDVSFAYPDGKHVLHGFSLRIDKGRLYAIVGRSGTGKSTLADLILGLVHPRDGVVRINDREVDASARHRIVLVEQQTRIFSATVRENLLLGLDRSDEEIRQALRTAALEDYVRALPQQLDTPFHYQGANLSGGQRQRVGIARALLRRPDVLILDEALSALDAETRSVVIDNLRASMASGILVFITHEPFVAGQADSVIDLDNPS